VIKKQATRKQKRYLLKAGISPITASCLTFLGAKYLIGLCRRNRRPVLNFPEFYEQKNI